MTTESYEALVRAREEINRRHLENGVRMMDIGSVYIEETVVIGPGTLLYPNVVLEGSTVIGSNCVIRSGTRICDSVLGDGTTAEQSVITESTVGSNTKIGPFAYLRPGSRIGDGCKVGDFVEIKNSTFGDGSKASHLSYIGDADIGKDVNVGCGVVFVNYDGSRKHRSSVGDGSFLGCNANIVSPVEIGEGAYVAAGSTVTRGVPGGSLCVARVRERIVDGWVARRGLIGSGRAGKENGGETAGQAEAKTTDK